MQLILQVLIGVLLGYSSFLDVKRKEIPLLLVLISFIYSIFLFLFYEQKQVISILVTIGIGGVFLTISRITRQAFGYGDSLWILTLGIAIGLLNLIQTLMIAFSIAAIVAIVLFLKKNNKKVGFQFLPMLWFGYVYTIVYLYIS